MEVTTVLREHIANGYFVQLVRKRQLLQTTDVTSFIVSSTYLINPRYDISIHKTQEEAETEFNEIVESMTTLL